MGVCGQRVEAVHQWAQLHSSGGRGCPCTCLAVYGEDTILSGGEDGRIALISPGQPVPVRVLGECVFVCVCSFVCVDAKVCRYTCLDILELLLSLLG